MSTNTIADAEGAIMELLGEVVALEATYDYPVSDIGRRLPAAVVLYDGFTSTTETSVYRVVRPSWEITVYWPTGGKTLESSWKNVKADAISIMDKFHQNRKLKDKAQTSEITQGQPFIEVPQAPRTLSKFIAHTFALTATIRRDQSARE